MPEVIQLPTVETVPLLVPIGHYVASVAVYVLATLLACGLVYRGERSQGRARWGWRILSALPLFLVSACRWDVGTDFYFTYRPAQYALTCLKAGGCMELVEQLMGPLFERLRNGEIDTLAKFYPYSLNILANQEWGFRVLMEAAAATGLGIRFVMAVSSAVVGAGVFVAIYRQSRSPTLATFFYVATSNYFLSMNIVRQYMAIALLLVAIEFIVRRKLALYVAAICMGALFHKTLLLLLPCYFLCRVPFRPWMAFALVAAALGFSAVAAPCALWILPKIGFGFYCHYFAPGSTWVPDGFEPFFFAINLCFLSYASWYWKRLRGTHPYFLVWYNLTLFGTLFLAVSGAIPQMKRINFYFAAPQFLMLPELLAAEENPLWRRVLTIGSIVAFLLETAVAVCILNKNGCLPYRLWE